MQDENKEENLEAQEDQDEVTFEPETDDDQVKPARQDLAGKIEKLKEELESCKKEKQEYLDGWQRMRADVANAKKREEDERKEFIKFAKSGVVEEMLQVLASFDMAMANKEAWEKVDSNWRSGVEYIYEQFKSVLESHGLGEVNPIGETFDPARDEAIEHVAVDDENQDHKIVEVIQKGYTLHDKIIRPAKVKVGEFKK